MVKTRINYCNFGENRACMKSRMVLLPMLIFIFQSFYAQIIPEGYLLQYQQNFSAAKALSDFRMENQAGWGIFKAGNNFLLQCKGADSAKPFPSNMAILNDRVLGDFIMEADIMPDEDSTGSREACVFLGFRNSSQYYLVQLADHSDSASHGIFLMKNSLLKKLSDSAKAITWAQNKWSKIRLERNITRRTIKVFVDDMTTPFMQVTDYELVMGSVGIGSFTGPVSFDNIRIWAPTYITDAELKSME
jgi:hypothetical protein